ncbi:NUDIX hydrolase [Nonomuraea recticatena]|uniref:NUDIX hydrolase n=1 Tax=Nonomuraea recticatena TaxID=46178 RepID=A0ABP6FP82_9ACTN
MNDHSTPTVSPTFVEPEIYYAQLASVHTATGALITDQDQRILLVKPNYRPHWLIPGGMADDGEPPEVACARELREELGVAVDVGRLLVVDWAPPYGHRTRPLVYFLFDGGTLADQAIELQRDELDDHAYVTVDEAVALSSPAVAARIPAALAAREQGTTVYRPQHG